MEADMSFFKGWCLEKGSYRGALLQNTQEFQSWGSQWEFHFTHEHLGFMWQFTLTRPRRGLGEVLT